MYEKAKIIIDKLYESGKYISTMESCTGGGVVNVLTSIPGASDVLKYSAVTYSNEFKIKMGVDEGVINKYTVYSKEVSVEMAKAISKYTLSNYGIGITGRLNGVDKNNPCGEDNVVFFTIYDKDNDRCYSNSLKVSCESRAANKEEVISYIFDKLLEII